MYPDWAGTPVAVRGTKLYNIHRLVMGCHQLRLFDLDAFFLQSQVACIPLALPNNGKGGDLGRCDDQSWGMA